MMEYTDTSTNEFVHFSSLPVELLVYIVSFLPLRDKVKLRYVSRTLRAVSETPSLWSEFVWPLYDRREERSVMKVLKICGDYIKQLIFPDHVTPSVLYKMLSYCKNVTQLSLPSVTKVDSKMLRIAVQHMNRLEKLQVQLSTDIKPLFQIGWLKELTVHVVVAKRQQTESFCTLRVQEWIANGFVPRNLNVVTHAFADTLKLSFLESWMRWNATIPMGHAACLKLYDTFRSPLNLVPVFPMVQLDFSQTAILPFVKANSFGLSGLERDLVLVTSSVHNGNAVFKAEIEVPDEYDHIVGRLLNNDVRGLGFITNFNFSIVRIPSIWALRAVGYCMSSSSKS